MKQDSESGEMRGQHGWGERGAAANTQGAAPTDQAAALTLQLHHLSFLHKLEVASRKFYSMEEEF